MRFWATKNYHKGNSLIATALDIETSLVLTGQIWEHILKEASWLTETTVLLFSAINGSICLELQMKALSTVQLRYNPLQLGLCKETEGRERERMRKRQG